MSAASTSAYLLNNVRTTSKWPSLAAEIKTVSPSWKQNKNFCLKLLIQHWSHRRYWFRAYRLQFTWSCSYLKSSNLPQLFTFQSKAVPTFHWNTQSVVEFAKVVPFFQWRAFRSLRTSDSSEDACSKLETLWSNLPLIEDKTSEFTFKNQNSQ